MKTLKILIVSIFAVIAFLSCDKDPYDAKNEPKTVSLEVNLTDSPADYKAVLIDLQDVLIKYSNSDTGWITLDYVEKGIYDLLKLTGGIDTLIAQSVVDTGTISQIRLILGDNNNLVISEDTIALKTPSAQQSGLKIKINKPLEPGYNYKILLDFDASKSVVKAGNSGKYILKPVIKAILEAQSGDISGSIADTISAVVYAYSNDDTTSTFTNPEGMFLIRGLEEGVYSVTIDPETGWNDTTISNVQVYNGSTTELGFITLSSN